MREKHLMQFICKIQPKNILIPTQVYFDEAYYQRDMYRDKLRAYRENQSDKKLLPSGLPKDYIQPIMQNLERRSKRPLLKREDGSYQYPQPAYLVLAAWSFILFTDAHIDKYFEGNFRELIKNYLDMCSSFPGLRDALTQALKEYDNAVNPSLFDIPPVAPKAPQSPLPEYGHSQKISLAALYPFVVQKEKAEEVIGLLRRYMEGINSNKPKDLMMPVRAAFDAGAILKPTYAKFKMAFPTLAPKNKSSFDLYLRPDIAHPYEFIPAFATIVEAFRKCIG